MLVKEHLAFVLRDEILSGRLQSGQPIVESKWAARLGVAQASVREAINILCWEGYVRKQPGRTARVIMLGDKELRDIYQVRVSLEATAARMVARVAPDLSGLDQVLADMRSAAECGNLRGYCERDLRFHVLMAELSGNLILADYLNRLISPLFAVLLLRAHVNPPAFERLHQAIARHTRIVDALRSCNPEDAEHEITASLEDIWLGGFDFILPLAAAAQAG